MTIYSEPTFTEDYFKLPHFTIPLKGHFTNLYRDFSLPFKEDNMPKKFWMVWRDYSPTTKHRHLTKLEAQIEADRIARLPENLGKKVYVLEAIDYRYVTTSPLMYGKL